MLGIAVRTLTEAEWRVLLGVPVVVLASGALFSNGVVLAPSLLEVRVLSGSARVVAAIAARLAAGGGSGAHR